VTQKDRLARDAKRRAEEQRGRELDGQIDEARRQGAIRSGIPGVLPRPGVADDGPPRQRPGGTHKR